MKTRRYVGNREEKITAEYEKLLSLICFVNEFPKTKRRKYPQYTVNHECRQYCDYLGASGHFSIIKY